MDRYRTEEIHDMDSNEVNRVMESARWADVLSDSSDHEL